MATFLGRETGNYSVNSSNILSKVSDFLNKGFQANKGVIPSPFIKSSATSAKSSSGSGGGSASISVPVGSSSAFYTDSSGTVRPADKSLDKVYEMIQQTSKANNEWSAAQAQKQMDFQREMSSTAHQREVEDLKNAGLNPVLSAGGNGASTPVGSMGQTDDSNTRLIADLAYAAIESLGQSAASYGVAAGGISKAIADSKDDKKSLSERYRSDPFFKKNYDTLANAGGYALGGFGAKVLLGALL